MSLRFHITLLLLCLALSRAALARGPEPAPSLSPATELLVDLVLQDRTVVSKTTVIYPFVQDWVFPLGELSDALGIAVSLSLARATAEGFILSPERTFALDTAACTVEIAGKREAYPCAQAVTYQDDIYVSRALLERWFPIRLEVLPFRARAVVTPLETLPLQARRERERRHGQTGAKREDRSYPSVEVPRTWLDGPLIDNEINYAYSGPSGKHQASLQTLAGGELLGWETQSAFAVSDKKLENWRATFALREPDGGLAGPLDLRDIQIFDVNLPVMPLISGGRQGRGAVISTFPLNSPDAWDTTSLSGPLPVGWDVELYRGGTFLDRRSSASGQYLFESVPLLFGINRFRLVFYGPRGERREIYRVFEMSGAPLPSGQSAYRVALARLADGNERGTVEYVHAFHRLIALRAGAVHDSGSSRRFGLLGLSHALGGLSVGTQCAVASDGGKACEVAPQFSAGEATVGARYTWLHQFRSDLFNTSGSRLETRRLDATLTWPLPLSPNLLLDDRVSRKELDDGSTQTSFQNRIAVQIGSLYLGNEIQYVLDTPRPFSTSLLGHYDVPRFQIQFGGKHTDRLEEIQLGAVYRPGPRLALLGSWKRNLVSEVSDATLQVSWVFPFLTVALKTVADSRGTHTAGVNLSFSLGRDPAEGSWHPSSDRIAFQGAASVEVFHDKNQNGRRDPEEAALPDIIVLVDRADHGWTTNAAGFAWISGLIPYRPVSISLSERSFDRNPFLRPGVEAMELTSRPGKAARILFPVITAGDVDGTVTIREAGVARPRRGIRVEVLGPDGFVAAAVKTDREGYYFIPRVSPGKYRLRIDPAQLAELGAQSMPAVHDLVMPEEGSLESGIDFRLDVVAPVDAPQDAGIPGN